MAYSGVLLLIHCLVGCLHSGATLCVLYCGAEAELSIASLVCWLALAYVPRHALDLHPGGVGSLHLSLALPV